MKRPVPPLLWIAIAAFGLIACVKFVFALRHGPATLLISVLVDAVLAIGLVHGRKWAYVLTIILSALGTAVSMGKGIEVGLGVLIGNAIIVVPLVLCTSFFFPKPSSPPQGNEATGRP